MQQSLFLQVNWVQSYPYFLAREISIQRKQGSASHPSMALIVSRIIFYFHIQTVFIGLETSQEIFGLTDFSPGFSYSKIGMLFYTLEMVVLAKWYQY